MLKRRHIDPFVSSEVTVTVTVKVEVKVKVEDLDEEERILPRMLLKEGVRENSCSLGE